MGILKGLAIFTGCLIVGIFACIVFAMLTGVVWITFKLLWNALGFVIGLAIVCVAIWLAVTIFGGDDKRK